MNQYELIEFFGVLPEVNEEDCYESYRVVKNDSVLEITFFYPEDIYISVFQDKFGTEVFSTKLEGKIKFKRAVYKNNYDCLELIIPLLKRYDEPDWDNSFVLRIFIEPNIRIEILR